MTTNQTSNVGGEAPRSLTRRVRISPKGRRTSAVLLALVVTLIAALASAIPATIEVIAKVSLGKNPKIVVQMTEPVKKAVVSLKREDGKSFAFQLGDLGAGAVKEILLDGAEARHKYEGAMQGLVGGEEMSSPLSFETVVASPLSIKVSREDLDLERRKLTITTSREVAVASLEIIGPDGSPLEKSVVDVNEWAKDAPIVLRWNHPRADDVVHLHVRVEDRDGFFNAVALTPWSVEIPHEEVHFATGSAKIESSEEPKLQDSLDKIAAALKKYSQIRGVQLFIAGHTDTQGGTASNLNLSRNRARAIAAWFVSQKLPIAVHFEGFGESSLKVKTADEVDEAQNRRVDYILGIEAPSLKSGTWKRLN